MPCPFNDLRDRCAARVWSRRPARLRASCPHSACPVSTALAGTLDVCWMVPDVNRSGFKGMLSNECARAVSLERAPAVANASQEVFPDITDVLNVMAACALFKIIAGMSPFAAEGANKPRCFVKVMRREPRSDAEANACMTKPVTKVTRALLQSCRQASTALGGSKPYFAATQSASAMTFAKTPGEVQKT